MRGTVRAVRCHWYGIANVIPPMSSAAIASDRWPRASRSATSASTAAAPPRYAAHRINVKAVSSGADPDRYSGPLANSSAPARMPKNEAPPNHFPMEKAPKPTNVICASEICPAYPVRSTSDSMIRA